MAVKRGMGSEIGRVASDARRGEDLMTKAAQKITLSPSRDAPFDKLMLSLSNVRRINAGVSVEELPEDIAPRRLLQSLSVRPVSDAEGTEIGKFGIPAGGRRFQALALRDKGQSYAEIASAFFVTPQILKQRLKLASVTPALHREPRSRASGSDLGCDQFIPEQGAIPDPAHADRDLGPDVRPARGL